MLGRMNTVPSICGVVACSVLFRVLSLFKMISCTLSHTKNSRLGAITAAAVHTYIQSSPYFDPPHTRTGWIGQPPILDRLEVVTDNGDVDTLGQATP